MNPFFFILFLGLSGTLLWYFGISIYYSALIFRDAATYYFLGASVVFILGWFILGKTLDNRPRRFWRSYIFSFLFSAIPGGYVVIPPGYLVGSMLFKKTGLSLIEGTLIMGFALLLPSIVAGLIYLACWFFEKCVGTAK